MSSPSGPHSHVQNATDTSSATCDTPAAPAYSTVSSTRFVNSSSTTNMPITHSGPTQPSSAARLTRIGAPAPSTGPIYGTNRNAAPSAAHTNGYGTLSNESPSQATRPYATLTSDCIS